MKTVAFFALLAALMITGSHAVRNAPKLPRVLEEMVETDDRPAEQAMPTAGPQTLLSLFLDKRGGKAQHSVSYGTPEHTDNISSDDDEIGQWTPTSEIEAASAGSAWNPRAPFTALMKQQLPRMSAKTAPLWPFFVYLQTHTNLLEWSSEHGFNNAELLHFIKTSVYFQRGVYEPLMLPVWVSAFTEREFPSGTHGPDINLIATVVREESKRMSPAIHDELQQLTVKLFQDFVHSKAVSDVSISFSHFEA